MNQGIKSELAAYSDAWNDDEEGLLEKAVRATGATPAVGAPLPMILEEEDDEAAR